MGRNIWFFVFFRFGGAACPAMLKGFFRPAFFYPALRFQYRENSVWWDKLLAGKICTHHCHYGYALLVFSDWCTAIPESISLKELFCSFCGINPVKVTVFFSYKKTSNKIKKNI
jgi:NAD(P)H dehydrogenase (quinone)